MLRSAMAEARVFPDPAGNAKLSKAGEGRLVQVEREPETMRVAAAIFAIAEGSPADTGQTTAATLRLSVI